MSNRLGGICYIKAGSRQFKVKGAVEAPLTDTKRETAMANDGPAGFTEEAREPFISFDAFFTPDFPLEEIKEVDTVTAEWPNGKVYTLSGAYLKGEPTVKSDEGIVNLEFGGARGTWA